MKKKSAFRVDATTAQRAECYNASEWGQRYPGSRLVVGPSGFVHGTWLLGNNYKGTGYYGAYPPQYLGRVGALFPDRCRVLHLFSGSLPKSKDYVTVDIQGKPSVQCDAHRLTEKFKLRSFDVIYADPPYTKADAARYDTPMINRRAVLNQCSAVLVSGGFLVWLDTSWPMVARTEFRLEGAILILRSQNHRVRVVFLFRKP